MNNNLHEKSWKGERPLGSEGCKGIQFPENPELLPGELQKLYIGLFMNSLQ